MNTSARLAWITASVIAGSLTATTVFGGVLVDNGKWTTISGGAYDGLSFLDVTESKDMTSAAAISSLATTYGALRLATPEEADGLIAASTIVLNNGVTQGNPLSLAWEPGLDLTLSSGSFYNLSVRDLLGTTNPLQTTTLFWTVPDGTSTSTSTRDAALFSATELRVVQSANLPPQGHIGWLLVQDGPPVEMPIPATPGLLLAGGAILAFAQRRKQPRGARRA